MEQQEPPGSAPGPQGPSPETLKSGLKAFKKRMKLTRLDDESRLGGGRPTTGGKKSAVVGIIPPREFPRAVWDELVKQGKLKNMGGGLHEFVKD
jgi:hypothetical protein